jgi:hypothetical protein
MDNKKENFPNPFSQIKNPDTFADCLVSHEINVDIPLSFNCLCIGGCGFYQPAKIWETPFR